MKQKINLAKEYLESIKREGTFDISLDEFESIGLEAVLTFYDLDFDALTESEKEELELEMKQMAQEVDFFRDAEEED